MADKVEYSRLILKRSNTPGVVPTISPIPGAGLNNMTATDTFVGELFANVQDDSVWIRTNNGQIPLLLSGSTFPGGSGNCITDLYITNLYGCSPIQLHNNFTFREDVDTPGQGVRLNSFSGNSYIALDKGYTNEIVNIYSQNPLATTTLSSFDVGSSGIYGIHQTLGAQDASLQVDGTAIILDKSSLPNNTQSYIQVQDTQQQLLVQDNLLAENSNLTLTQTQSTLQNTDGNDTATYTQNKTNINLDVNDTIDTSIIDMNKNAIALDIDNLGGHGKKGFIILDPANQASATGTHIKVEDTNTGIFSQEKYDSNFVELVVENPTDWQIRDYKYYDGVTNLIQQVIKTESISQGHYAHILVDSKTTTAGSNISMLSTDGQIEGISQVASNMKSYGSSGIFGDIGALNSNVQATILGISIDPGIGGNLQTSNIPAYDDDAAAGLGGLATGMLYQTTGAGAAPLNAAGILMVKQ